MPVKSIALVGGNGSLGSVILTALLAAKPPHGGPFTVTVLQRESSFFPAPPGANRIRIPDSFPLDALTAAVQNHDAVIAAFPLRDVSVHLRIAEAAFAAGVKRVIPADYGSVDSRSEYARELVPLFGKKAQVRELLRELSTKRNDFGWTSLVVGHFFDWGLGNGFLHFWPDEKRAEILGTGNERSSLSTLSRVAESVVKILGAEDAVYEKDMKGRVLMVQSFCVSQMEVLRVLEKVTGEKWKVEWRDREEFIKTHKARADAGDKASIEDLVFALGVVDGNWEEKEDFAMGLLGFENEDLETEVRKALGVAGFTS
ncbi:NmrA-like family protein [Cercophora newfieldiana]|uniref:NmrA-like family protein n=1 Tax=Cercophora newfieldiana TaxID=92897 RepID=A0AA40CSQ8_9PEZI|nr:NmrA-like family protein [Cercophora newfieldiana]